MTSWISDKSLACIRECKVQNAALIKSIPTGIFCALLQTFQGNAFTIYYITSDHFL